MFEDGVLRGSFTIKFTRVQYYTGYIWCPRQITFSKLFLNCCVRKKSELRNFSILFGRSRSVISVALPAVNPYTIITSILCFQLLLIFLLFNAPDNSLLPCLQSQLLFHSTLLVHSRFDFDFCKHARYRLVQYKCI